MKLIFENWRPFLLERATDATYNKITEYFFDILQNYKKYFRNIDVEQNRLYNKAVGLEDDSSEQEYFFLKTDKSKFDKSEFDRYQKFTGDDAVMPTLEIFQDAMSRFILKAVDKEVRPGAAGDMSHHGEMRIFVKERPKNVDSFVNSIPITLLEHELGHWLNAIRSGYKVYRTSGAGKHTDDQFDHKKGGGVQYANSTEEMQARITEVFAELKRQFSDFADQDFYDSFENKDPKSFINLIIKHYGDSEFYYSQLTVPNKRRLIKRIYEMYEYFLANRDKFKGIESYADKEVETL